MIFSSTNKVSTEKNVPVTPFFEGQKCFSRKIRKKMFCQKKKGHRGEFE